MKRFENTQKNGWLFKKVGDEFERGAANLEGDTFVDEPPHLGTCASSPGESRQRPRLQGKITTLTACRAENHDRDSMSRGESRQRLLVKRRIATKTSPQEQNRDSEIIARRESRHMLYVKRRITTKTSLSRVCRGC